MWRALRILLIVIVAPLAATAADNKFTDADRRLAKFFSLPLYRNAPDVYLAKTGAFGDLQRVAVFYGFANNFGFCNEMKDACEQRYPQAEYTCDLANLPQ